MIIKKEDGTTVKVKTTNGLSTVSVSPEDANKEAKKVSNFFKNIKESKVKIIANDPKEQDLADYLEAISSPYVKLVTEAHFASMVDGRVRAIKTIETENGLEFSIIFPQEEVPPEFEKVFKDNFNDILA